MHHFGPKNPDKECGTEAYHQYVYPLARPVCLTRVNQQGFCNLAYERDWIKAFYDIEQKYIYGHANAHCVHPKSKTRWQLVSSHQKVQEYIQEIVSLDR